MRIGQGYDSHRLETGIPLYLGGVELKSSLGALGHSDGDCLLHALIDALMGALGLGDIGRWFPDTDPALKGIRSDLLLERFLKDPRTPSFRIINADMTIFTDTPKIAPVAEKIVANLSRLLSTETKLLNLKAKTWEGLQKPENLVLACSVTLLLEL